MDVQYTNSGEENHQWTGSQDANVALSELRGASRHSWELV